MSVGFFTNRSVETVRYYNGRLTSFVVLSCLMAATGGIIFGYDLGISGGVTSMETFLKKFFPEVYVKMRQSNTSNYCKFDSQLLTWFTSSLYLAGLVTSFFASPVTRNYGRKASMLIGGVAFMAGGALGGLAVNVYMLILGRLLLGVGLGFANQAVPLYLAEMTPPQYRGAVTSGFSTCTCIGIIFATLVNFATEKINGDLGWRISLGLASIPAALLTLAAIFLPETPSSLIQREADIQKITELLQKIRGTMEVDRELEDLIIASNMSKSINNPYHEIIQPKYRPPLVMATLIPIFQQVTGINVITFYAPVLFRSIGLKESASLMSAVMTGVIGLGANIISMTVIDKFGRRALLMIGGVQMLISQLMVGALLESQLKDQGGVNKIDAYLVLVLIGVYVLGFSSSWGPLGWVVPSEIFPLEIRSAGQSINLIVSFFFIFIIGQSFLAMLCRFEYGIFYFFGEWVLVMTVFVYLFLPETANVPIEQMVQVWGKHWFWKRFVGSREEIALDMQDAINTEVVIMI